jgi:glycosyltransferase involved in cell wall biosynthesis
MMTNNKQYFKIAIASVGRFHVLDLARELSALGHDVVFYSYVPRKRAIRFGLPAACHRNFLLCMAPLLVMQRFGPRRFADMFNYWIHKAMNLLVKIRLEPCDVFIGTSGIYLEAAQYARKRYGARILIERGSRHILSQKQILESMPGGENAHIPEHDIERELKGYALADYIVVPSSHAEESFLELGMPREKLFRNPYGVDLNMFQPTCAPPAAAPAKAIITGAWSLRKGCDILTAAWRQIPELGLIHVGAVVDAPLPQGDGFEHHDPVDQTRLRQFYAEARVFVLASREEGLSLVQAQALACGLPVVCTDRTGGADLAELADLKEGVFVVPHDNVQALADALRKALQWSTERFAPGTVRDILGARRDSLSWQAYGRRYEIFLTRVMGVAP